MIEKFFGGCESEKIKINELIETVNGMGEGTSIEIKDETQHFYPFDIKNSFECTITEIDIDNYSLFFGGGYGTISNLREGSIRICGKNSLPYNYGNSFFLGNAQIYHGDDIILKSMGYTKTNRYCYIDYTSGEFSENDGVSFRFVSVNKNL